MSVLPEMCPGAKGTENGPHLPGGETVSRADGVGTCPTEGPERVFSGDCRWHGGQAPGTGRTWGPQGAVGLCRAGKKQERWPERMWGHSAASGTRGLS